MSFSGSLIPGIGIGYGSRILLLRLVKGKVALSGRRCGNFEGFR